jgi:hypothetical protein
MRSVELSLGVRIVLGRAAGRARALLTALGVALGVTVLLVAASIPHAVSRHDARVDSRSPRYALGPGRLRLIDSDTVFHGLTISGTTVQGVGPRAPVPPGVPRLPRPGEMFVSPALAGMLHAHDGGELRRRLGARVAGLIGDTALSGPHEATFLRGADLRALGIPADASGWGIRASPSFQDVVTSLLTVVLIVGLLLPVGLFGLTAARFGAEERDRRLGAFRLVGVDARGTAWLAAGETLPAVVGGVVLGAGAFLALRPLASHVGYAGIDVFTSDVTPSPLLAALVAVLVPATAILATLVGIRGVVRDPLRASGRGAVGRRRLAWRLVAPVVGFLLLAEFLTARSRLAQGGGQVQAGIGVALVLIGLTTVLPWLVEAAVRHAPDGPVPWLLAIRRLRQEEGTTVRVIAAIALTVAAAIALSVVFGAAQSERRVVDERAGQGHSLAVTLYAADRAALNAQTTGLRRAAERDGGLQVTAPSSGSSQQIQLFVELPAHAGDVADRLRNQISAIAPLASVDDFAPTSSDRTLDNLQRMLDAGAALMLMMIGLSLLIAAAEQLRDRRRALSDLSAAGVRRATVAWSLLWQTAIPVLAGLALAITIGLALGLLLSKIVDLSPTYDWGAIALMSGTAIAVIAVVSALSLPALRRAMSPDALWTE